MGRINIPHLPMMASSIVENESSGTLWGFNGDQGDLDNILIESAELYFWLFLNFKMPFIILNHILDNCLE